MKRVMMMIALALLVCGGLCGLFLLQSRDGDDGARRLNRRPAANQ